MNEEEVWLSAHNLPLIFLPKNIFQYQNSYWIYLNKKIPCSLERKGAPWSKWLNVIVGLDSVYSFYFLNNPPICVFCFFLWLTCCWRVPCTSRLLCPQTSGCPACQSAWPPPVWEKHIKTTLSIQSTRKPRDICVKMSHFREKKKPFSLTALRLNQIWYSEKHQKRQTQATMDSS